MINHFYGEEAAFSLKQSNGVVTLTPQTTNTKNWTATTRLSNLPLQMIAAFKQFSAPHPAFFYVDLICNLYFTLELVIFF